jgi:hypothetical protein
LQEGKIFEWNDGRLKCSTESLQEIFSRQGAKSAKKIIFQFSELGVLCVPSASLRTCFARGIFGFKNNAGFKCIG